MHYRIASATALALILSGCATPRHTNLLIFGTNTVVGLKVGADATQTPAIQLAYSRQELVLMPVLANTGMVEDGDNRGRLTPCPAKPDGDPVKLAKNCKFIGTDKDGSEDSYSVLASFGAKGDASGSTASPKAGGAIAQYFATGLAARELAKHGSALVAASESATAEAKASNPVGFAWIQSRKAKFLRIADLLNNAGSVDDKSLSSAMKKLDAAAGTDEIFQDLCMSPVTKAQCIQKIRDQDSADILSLTDRELDNAFTVIF